MFDIRILSSLISPKFTWWLFEPEGVELVVVDVLLLLALDDKDIIDNWFDWLFFWFAIQFPNRFLPCGRANKEEMNDCVKTEHKLAKHLDASLLISFSLLEQYMEE